MPNIVLYAEHIATPPGACQASDCHLADWPCIKAGRRWRPQALKKPMGKATQRAIDILELLAHDDGKWSHAEIARRLDIPKSTLTDLLRDLVQRQYLELDSGAALYLLGQRVLTLSP